MSYEDGMPAGGNSRFRNYSARVSERQQLALIMQMTSQEMTSGSSNRSESTIPLSNVRSSPLQHQKNSKNRWSNKNAELLDVNTSYNRQDDRLRLANGCDSKDRSEFAGSNSPDEVRTASEAESPRAAGSPAECAATATSTSTSASGSSVEAVVEEHQLQDQQQQQSQEQQHLESYEMRRTPPQSKVDRQASGQQQQQQQSGGGGSNAGNNSGGNSARLRLNQVRATRDEKKGTSAPGTNIAGTATTAAGQASSSSCSNASSRQAAAISTAAASGSTSLL
ncbi:ras-interacting protein RIP3-like [Copidosoma floridanum]|uniref:ras-interacting protein RIP3-like n=1 Tax=Copidosoma floridanum TaxID=29053 RepID=UPI000C6F7592|nr:ras-interacting protein RIP3-like [Copidosoma floridanum]